MCSQLRAIEKKLEIISFKLSQSQDFCPARKAALSEEAEKILHEIGLELHALPKEESETLYNQVFAAFTACVDARMTLGELPLLERWGWFCKSSGYKEFESFFRQIQDTVTQCIDLCSSIGDIRVESHSSREILVH